MAQNNRIIELVAHSLPRGGTPSARMKRATAIFAGMMGTLQLVRIATNEEQANEILLAGLTRSGPWRRSLGIKGQRSNPSFHSIWEHLMPAYVHINLRVIDPAKQAALAPRFQEALHEAGGGSCISVG
jgi:hypothetical protein